MVTLRLERINEMAYYTLLTRSHSTGLEYNWFPQFGDYEKQTVQDEMQGMKDYNKLHGFKEEFKILRTKSCRQKEINVAIERLNSK